MKLYAMHYDFETSPEKVMGKLIPVLQVGPDTAEAILKEVYAQDHMAVPGLDSTDYSVWYKHILPIGCSRVLNPGIRHAHFQAYRRYRENKDETGPLLFMWRSSIETYMIFMKI
jgi:hypothetical protein